MKRSREVNVFSIAFLDLLSGALGAVIILFIAVPKAKSVQEKTSEIKKEETVKEKVIEKPSKNVTELESLIKVQAKLVKEYKKEVTRKDEIQKKLKRDLASLKTELSKTQKRLSSNAKNNFSPKLSSSSPIDVGFKFKGKRILFVIDISGSMVQEERISSVKAGLKMLITSMSTDFKIDVVSFPAPSRTSSYQELWGSLKNMTDKNKLEVFSYLYSLSPNGRTPTRDVLRYAFKNYYGLSDIVLLTDGVPTKSKNGNPDDIYSILSEVSGMNNTNIQVNAIGVGTDFINKKDNKAYQFLNRLTKQNHGFFVGF
ncbi:VWA domain-containing protein [bacterium]|nr:VWA domain-containing protein [bacterium]